LVKASNRRDVIWACASDLTTSSQFLLQHGREVNSGHYAVTGDIFIWAALLVIKKRSISYVITHHPDSPELCDYEAVVSGADYNGLCIFVCQEETEASLEEHKHIYTCRPVLGWMARPFVKERAFFSST